MLKTDCFYHEKDFSSIRKLLNSIIILLQEFKISIFFFFYKTKDRKTMTNENKNKKRNF